MIKRAKMEVHPFCGFKIDRSLGCAFLTHSRWRNIWLSKGYASNIVLKFKKCEIQSVISLRCLAPKSDTVREFQLLWAYKAVMAWQWPVATLPRSKCFWFETRRRESQYLSEPSTHFYDHFVVACLTCWALWARKRPSFCTPNNPQRGYNRHFQRAVTIGKSCSLVYKPAPLLFSEREKEMWRGIRIFRTNDEMNVYFGVNIGCR